MKDYKRLTFDCWKYDEFLKQDEKYVRLAELEDKIESGELCEREEIRKETAKNILTGLYELTQRHYGNKYLLSSRDVIDIAERYGIELFEKTEQVENFDKLEDEK